MCFEWSRWLGAFAFSHSHTSCLTVVVISQYEKCASSASVTQLKPQYPQTVRLLNLPAGTLLRSNLAWSTLFQAWIPSDRGPSGWKLWWRQSSAVIQPAEDHLTQIHAFEWAFMFGRLLVQCYFTETLLLKSGAWDRPWKRTSQKALRGTALGTATRSFSLLYRSFSSSPKTCWRVRANHDHVVIMPPVVVQTPAAHGADIWPMGNEQRYQSSAAWKERRCSQQPGLNFPLICLPHLGCQL